MLPQQRARPEHGDHDERRRPGAQRNPTPTHPASPAEHREVHGARQHRLRVSEHVPEYAVDQVLIPVLIQSLFLRLLPTRYLLPILRLLPGLRHITIH